MKISKLSDMTRGWFVGDFEPTLYRTRDCEVAVKTYAAGDYEEKHYHKIATEISVVIYGRVRMFDEEFCENDIIIVEPGDETDFTALVPTQVCVVKIPGAVNDKYLSEESEGDA